MVSRALRPHHLGALALACVLTLAWAWRDWAALSVLRLPDTDDVMRLQQVRDWIAGQPFADVSQHRLADGLAMHWSRIGDIVPALVILTFKSLTGQHIAEIVAVVAWPLMQFAMLLILVGSVAEKLALGARGTAITLAALAYPAITLFMPGRIDHHAMQVLLVLVQVRALLAPPDLRSGAIAGLAVAVGAAIGLETLPFALLTGVSMALGGGERQRGFGLALGAAIVALQPVAAHGGLCDTFDPLAKPALFGAIAMAMFAGRGRFALLAFSGAAITAYAWPSVQPCLAGPYANVDRSVARLWLDQVAEAQPLFGAPATQAIGYAGLLLAGLIASCWLARIKRGGWLVLLAFSAVSFAVALAQLRGVYVGAGLAAVPIAALLAEARAKGRMLRVAGLWIGGAGLLYPIAASAFVRRAAGDAVPSCVSTAALATLAASPPGRLMAPIDLGPYVIAGTRMTAIAAPYHRNNAGNAAMLRFFLGTPAEAAAVARQWRIDIVAQCPGGFGAVTPPPGSIASGARPAWLIPLTTPGVVPQLFTVRYRSPKPESAT